MATKVEPLSTDQLVDAQGEAVDELHQAAELQHIPPQLLTHDQKQRLYIATLPDRCPRCGAHVVTLFGTGGFLCSRCIEFLQTLEAPVRWFSSLMAEAMRKQRADK